MEHYFNYTHWPIPPNVLWWHDCVWAYMQGLLSRKPNCHHPNDIVCNNCPDVQEETH